MKCCRTCGETKPLGEFYKTSSSGLFSDCKGCISESRRLRYKEKREEIKRYASEYQERNLARTRYWMRRWTAKNQSKIKADLVMPSWANLSLIEAMYAKARRLSKATGARHVVDHIVPVNSTFVCGLHCESNLQILTNSENCRKHNRWWPDMWPTEEIFLDK